MTTEIPMFPVTEYELRSVKAYGCVLLRLGFISSPMQSIGEADPGRNYALTRAQALELAEALRRSVAKMDQLPDQSPPDPQH